MTDQLQQSGKPTGVDMPQNPTMCFAPAMTHRISVQYKRPVRGSQSLKKEILLTPMVARPKPPSVWPAALRPAWPRSEKTGIVEGHAHDRSAPDPGQTISCGVPPVIATTSPAPADSAWRRIGRGASRAPRRVVRIRVISCLDRFSLKMPKFRQHARGKCCATLLVLRERCAAVFGRGPFSRLRPFGKRRGPWSEKPAASEDKT